MKRTEVISNDKAQFEKIANEKSEKEIGQKRKDLLNLEETIKRHSEMIQPGLTGKRLAILFFWFLICIQFQTCITNPANTARELKQEKKHWRWQSSIIYY